MAGSVSAGFIQTSIEWAALGVEALAVVVIVAGVVKVTFAPGTFGYVFQIGKPVAFESYKHLMGKPLLLGLDLLLAGDVIKTVALEATLPNLAALGLLVLVRTFLSWSLTVEMEGRWPWQARADKDEPDQAVERAKEARD